MYFILQTIPKDWNGIYISLHLQGGQGHVEYDIVSIDELVQERRKSIANALELRLSCTNPLILCLLMTRQPKQLGGRLNKKDSLTRYGDSHVKDKTS